jgi:hypothetical protein
MIARRREHRAQGMDRAANPHNRRVRQNRQTPAAAAILVMISVNIAAKTIVYSTQIT